MIDDRLAVLVSGSGTLLKAVLDATIPPVYLVGADRDCAGYNKVPEGRVDRRFFTQRHFGSSDNKEAISRETGEILRFYQIGAVFMAGYRTLLHECFFYEYGYAGRVANAHPSFQMKYIGDDAITPALEAGEEVVGCTLHLATERMDDSRFILKTWPVPVLPGDTKDTAQERVKVTERREYPALLRTFLLDLRTRNFTGYADATRAYLEKHVGR